MDTRICEKCKNKQHCPNEDYLFSTYDECCEQNGYRYFESIYDDNDKEDTTKKRRSITTSYRKTYKVMFLPI